mgnify:CR=1 FL=1
MAKKATKKTPSPVPSPPSTLQKCRRVLAMAGLAVAEAASLSEAEQASYAQLIDDDGEPTVPNLLQAVCELRAKKEVSDEK